MHGTNPPDLWGFGVVSQLFCIPTLQYNHVPINGFVLYLGWYKGLMTTLGCGRQTAPSPHQRAKEESLFLPFCTQFRHAILKTVSQSGDCET